MLHRVKNSVKSSIKDGVCWAAMFGFVEPYIVPFALGLGTSNLVIGIVRSLPVLMASFAQVFAEFFVYYFKSCKKVVFWTVFAQALSLFFASLCVFAPAGPAIYLFIFFMVFYSIGGGIATAPWLTLVGEYLPADKRGEFFGFRNRLIAVSYFSASFLASLLLNVYGKHLVSFFVLFFTASLFRFCSVHYISLMYESPNRFHIPRTFSGLIFPVRGDEGHPGVHKIFISLFILLFSTYIAAPYFSVYVLKDLGFDYVRYMIVMSIGQFLTWMLMKYWGILLDRKGCISVLKYAFWFIPVVSLLWLCSGNFYYLTAVEIFSGVAWSAFGLGVTNLVYEYLEPPLRTRYNSHLIFLMSLAQFGGSLLGGFLYDHFSGVYDHPFFIVLGLSTAGRFAALLHFYSVKKHLVR